MTSVCIHQVNNDIELNQFDTKIQVFIHFAPCWILFLPEQLGIGTSVQLGVRDNDWKRPSIEIKRRLSST